MGDLKRLIEHGGQGRGDIRGRIGRECDLPIEAE
jgi:hypothetical protein